MELNKTKCNACGHLNRWYSYKLVSSEGRKEHNHRNSTECPECGSEDVTEFDDDETMAPYHAMAEMLFGLVKKREEKETNG